MDFYSNESRSKPGEGVKPLSHNELSGARSRPNVNNHQTNRSWAIWSKVEGQKTIPYQTNITMTNQQHDDQPDIWGKKVIIEGRQERKSDQHKAHQLTSRK